MTKAKAEKMKRPIISIPASHAQHINNRKSNNEKLHPAVSRRMRFQLFTVHRSLFFRQRLNPRQLLALKEFEAGPAAG